MSEVRNLVQINKPKAATDLADQKISRRGFLKVLGSASAVGVAGCADRATQTVLPYVKGEPEQIPGVAVWYKSTCNECSAGCGVMVRTREGRAVKIEGNPENPVNRGGLCALGQSALQSLYDPDRVRQPLRKVKSATGHHFEAITWDQAYSTVTDSLKDSAKKKAVITGELSGALADLVDDWSKGFGLTQAAFDFTQATALARACEVLYGTYGIPQFHFDQAGVILNFGADFLETWISPVGFARDWAKGKKSGTPPRLVHVEPRLSLTGANADQWLSNNPGTEIKIALVVLKELIDSGRGQNLSDVVRAKCSELTKGLSLEQVSDESGVSRQNILSIVDYLREAKSSLVIAGGAASASQNSMSLMMVTLLINHVLENVGRTVDVSSLRRPRSSLADVSKVIEALNKGQLSTVFLLSNNARFTVPSSFGLEYALKKADLVVAITSHLDESADAADIILPTHNWLEGWSDVRQVPGVYGLCQPVMAPIFDTRNAGDVLLQLASKAGNNSVAAGNTDFESYLKASWKKLHQTLKITKDFNSFWQESVERGGYFDQPESPAPVKLKFELTALDEDFKSARFDSTDLKNDDLVLLPYLSVRSFDGRAANRPWLQELPDPITQVVWDSWAEINPKTAAEKGLAFGDFVTIRNKFGEINVPAYLSEYVKPGVVAVPIGQGHTSYGRFAKSVGGGNVLELLPANASADGRSLALLSTRVSVFRGRGKAKLVGVQGSDQQLGRELARTKLVAPAAAVAAHGGGHEHGHEGGHAAHGGHELKQMYDQRQHPVYRWGLAVDLSSCTGCSACVVACSAENNVPVVGKKVVGQGREMSWLRIERYFDGSAEELQVGFLPMMCQHCTNAPCEVVCPVYATYHNEEGLNAMVYNRCVGTRYCSNNCPYKQRRFNWFEYEWPELLDWQLNPDVQKRTSGVMEKCTFCVQRIAEAKDHAKDEGRLVHDREIQPACVQSCPTQALTFGNLNDPDSEVSKLAKSDRAYKVLDHHLNTQPAVSYLERIKYEA